MHVSFGLASLDQQLSLRAPGTYHVCRRVLARQLPASYAADNLVTSSAYDPTICRAGPAYSSHYNSEAPLVINFSRGNITQGGFARLSGVIPTHGMIAGNILRQSLGRVRCEVSRAKGRRDAVKKLGRLSLVKQQWQPQSSDFMISGRRRYSPEVIQQTLGQIGLAQVSPKSHRKLANLLDIECCATAPAISHIVNTYWQGKEYDGTADVSRETSTTSQ